MAAAAASAEAGEAAAGKGGGGKKKLILIAVPLLLGGIGAGLWFSGILPSMLGMGAHHAADEHAEAPAAEAPRTLSNTVLLLPSFCCYVSPFKQRFSTIDHPIHDAALFDAEIGGGGEDADAGVVDQDVEFAETAVDGAKQRVHLRGIGDIRGLTEDTVTVLLAQFPCGLVQAV